MKRLLCAALATLTLLLPTVSAAPTAQAAQTAAASPATTTTFSDVAANHWANAYIQRAYNNSWVHGMGDGRYAPTQPLTNAAFLTMITNVFFPETQDAITVPAGSPWYTLYWEVAQREGITVGTTVQSMDDMNRSITRYDMAQMIMNVLEKDLYIPEGAIQQVSASIQDWEEIPPTYQHAVAAAYALGVLNGKDGQFVGADPMTRAESAVVLCRMSDAAVNGYVPSSPIGNTPNTKPNTPPPANVNPNGNTNSASGSNSTSHSASPSTPNSTSSTSPNATPSTTPSATTNGNTANDHTSSTKPDSTASDTGSIATDASTDPSTDPSGDSSNSSTDSTSPQASTASNTTSSTSTSVNDLLAEAVRLTNLEREKEGLAALGTYSTLTQAAQLRAPELKRLFSHTRPDGTSYVTALEETGAKKSAYTYGENIFSGSNDPAAAVAAWMDSTADRKNILNAGFTHVAIGYYNNCWVQLFVGTNVNPDDSFDSNDNNSSSSPTTQNVQSIQFFPPVVQVRTNGQYFPTVLDQDFREVPSGVTWTNETPDLFTINKRTRVCEIGTETGTGSLIATVNGRTARLIIEIVDSEDKVDLSSTMILSSVGKSQIVQLYIPRNNYFYGQDYTVSWDVQDPNVVQIEEVDTTKNPGIRCTMMNAGTTAVTCTVTLSDGYSTSSSCYIHVAEAE